jgi:carbon-monoxide dehydrogenase small subunit
VNAQTEGTAPPSVIDAAERIEVSLTVNGEQRSAAAEPRLLLSDFLRHELGLTGTHVGCEHGVCGACTVRVDGELVRSCLMLAVQAEGAEVETVEGVGNGGEGLAAVQEAMHEAHGIQCGFCTPGFVIAVGKLLEDIEDPTEEQIRDYLAGNVCRCTGYDGIVKAVGIAKEKLGRAGR